MTASPATAAEKPLERGGARRGTLYFVFYRYSWQQLAVPGAVCHRMASDFLGRSATTEWKWPAKTKQPGTCRA